MGPARCATRLPVLTTTVARQAQSPGTSRGCMAVELRRRVDFPMVDLANVIYYPQYFDRAHRFFEESFEHILGTTYAEMITELKVGFPVADTAAQFHAPLRYGDEIRCKLWIESVGTSSVIWRYAFRNQRDELCWSARIVTVCADLRNFEKRPVPEEWVEPLRNCTED